MLYMNTVSKYVHNASIFWYQINIHIYCTICCVYSTALFVVFTVHIPPCLYFLDRCAVVLYILYTESHLIRSQIPCLCKLTWPILAMILILILIYSEIL